MRRLRSNNWRGIIRGTRRIKASKEIEVVIIKRRECFTVVEIDVGIRIRVERKVKKKPEIIIVNL